MNATGQRRITPILVGIALALAATVFALAAGVGRGARWGAAATLPPLPAAGPQAAGSPPDPLERHAVTWQRPLFNPTRRPLARAANGRSSVGDFTLTGIILTPTLRMALVHDRKDKRELRVREGDASADGSVRLVEVHPRSALFDSPAGRVELYLPSGAPVDAAPPPAAAVAGPDAPPDSRTMAASAPQDPLGADGRPADARAAAMETPRPAEVPAHGAESRPAAALAPSGRPAATLRHAPTPQDPATRQRAPTRPPRNGAH